MGFEYRFMLDHASGWTLELFLKLSAEVNLLLFKVKFCKILFSAVIEILVAPSFAKGQCASVDCGSSNLLTILLPVA